MRSPFTYRCIEKIWPGPHSIGKIWRAWCAATGGNTTIVFALACIPLFGLVGAAVDYSRANAIRTAMQAAADSTALAMSLVVSKNPTISTTDLQTQADTYFTAMFTRKDATLQHPVTATATTTGGNQVFVSAKAIMNTDFMGVLSIKQMPLAATSTTAWGSARLRVALVLDNTGSMNDSGKLQALINATKSLLTQLQNAATTAGDVYVSIVPFVNDIRVDTTNYTANWLYWGTAAQDPTLSDDTSWEANNGTCSSGNAQTRAACFHNSCSVGGYTNKSTCTTTNGCTNPLQTTQSACTGQQACSLQYTSQWSCSQHGGTWGYGKWKIGTWDSSVTWTPDAHKTWNGCISDRGDATGPDAGNYDTNTTAPTTTNVGSLFAAAQCTQTSLQKVMPLSYNWSTMTTYVNNMVAGGSTNQNIGLVHGWQSLVGGGPYPAPPAQTSGYTYQQVIVLLTDGLNTQNRWWGDGSSLGTTDDQNIDNRQYLTCANIKAAGITIYAIQVNTDSSPTSTLLKTCATDSSKFYLLTSSNQILDTFTQIGNKLSQLRVAK